MPHWFQGSQKLPFDLVRWKGGKFCAPLPWHLPLDMLAIPYMRVLLQHKVTDCYFQMPDRWTPLDAEGSDFGSFEEAVLFAQARQLVNVQIACWCVPNGQRFLLSIPDPAATRPSRDGAPSS